MDDRAASKESSIEGWWRVARLAGAMALCLGLPATAWAQVTGAVAGRVVTEAGEPLAGARVVVAASGGGAAAVERRVAETDGAGRFRFAGVPAGEVEVRAEYLGRHEARSTVRVVSGEVVEVELRLAVSPLATGELVVTASREAVRRAETSAAVGVVAGEVIREAKPAHPSEVLNRVAGVWVNVTGGEGHMAAIRQPKTTSPVYLYLEDGVPTRSTGFFNHNALYEVNLPQADRIEVVKGPATALYGSDAIGGTVNVSTAAPAAEGLRGSAEAGAFGFARLLASYAEADERGGYRAGLNVTRTDGWRDGTAYDRQSAVMRWDRSLGGAGGVRATVTASRIDQGTAGSSALRPADYEENPTANYTPISYRKVEAVRAAAAWERMDADATTLLSVTPFVRWNRMEMLPNWSLTYDPAVSETGHASVGALLKVRRDFAPLRARVIAGADLDWSPGVHEERRVVPVREAGVFVSYEEGDVIYDYDVRFAGASPWVQAEVSPLTSLRFTGGLRFDHLSYDYENGLGELQTGAHRRPASTSVSYSHLSPKLGVTFAPREELGLYASYGHGFRAPSEGQLFRQGRAANTLGLRPVKADSWEVGARGLVAGRLSWDVAAYHMVKTDDILSLTNPDGSTETANAGETLHRGLEVGAGALLPLDLRLDVALAWSEHTYEEWRPREGVVYDGNEMEDAPRSLVNVALGWTPSARPGLNLSAEWAHIGRYWMDAENTVRYPGHDVFNVRARVPVTRGVTVFGRLMNVTDERYAESAAYTVARGEEYAPGLPRTLYLGLEVR